jgi:hypothetical protein
MKLLSYFLLLCALPICAGAEIDSMYVERVDTMASWVNSCGVEVGWKNVNRFTALDSIECRSTCHWVKYDTVWAKKVQAWFTPKQLAKLFDLLEPKDDTVRFRGVFDPGNIWDFVPDSIYRDDNVWHWYDGDTLSATIDTGQFIQWLPFQMALPIPGSQLHSRPDSVCQHGRKQ